MIRRRRTAADIPSLKEAVMETTVLVTKLILVLLLLVLLATPRPMTPPPPVVIMQPAAPDRPAEGCLNLILILMIVTLIVLAAR